MGFLCTTVTPKVGIQQMGRRATIIVVYFEAIIQQKEIIAGKHMTEWLQAEVEILQLIFPRRLMAKKLGIFGRD